MRPTLFGSCRATPTFAAAGKAYSAHVEARRAANLRDRARFSMPLARSSQSSRSQSTSMNRSALAILIVSTFFALILIDCGSSLSTASHLAGACGAPCCSTQFHARGDVHLDAVRLLGLPQERCKASDQQRLRFIKQKLCAARPCQHWRPRRSRAGYLQGAALSRCEYGNRLRGPCHQLASRGAIPTMHAVAGGSGLVHSFLLRRK